jgi:hypothetical protein
VLFGGAVSVSGLQMINLRKIYHYKWNILIWLSNKYMEEIKFL